MKDFLLICDKNCATYKEVFPLLKNDKARAGYVFNKTLEFETPEGETKKQTGICWYTTFPVIHKHLVLTKTYNPHDFQAYDNYNAINVDKVKDIPYDYEGTMGVPITIFQYDLDNVEVIGLGVTDSGISCGVKTDYSREEVERYKKDSDAWRLGTLFFIENCKTKVPYARVLIKKNFEVLQLHNSHGKDPEWNMLQIDGKDKYARILIKTTNPKQPKTNDIPPGDLNKMENILKR